MTIKLTRSFDYEKAVRVARSAMLQYFNEVGLEWNDEDRLDIYRSRELYEVSDEEQIGLVLLREHDGKFFLADLQVLESQRNKGYGSSLLAIVQKIARERGYSQVWLKVFKTSPAYQFYKRNGYEVVAEETHLYVLRANT